MNDNYLYVLKDPRDGIIRYVGVTGDISARYGVHIHCMDRYNPGKNAWIQELKKLGLLPIMEILKSDMPRAQAEHEEVLLIHEMLANGVPLLNLDMRRPFSHWTQVTSDQPVLFYKVVCVAPCSWWVIEVVNEEKLLYRMRDDHKVYRTDYQAYAVRNRLNNQRRRNKDALHECDALC